MRLAGGVLQITAKSGNYRKGRVGHQSFYVSSKNRAMTAQIDMLSGEIVEAELVRGMVVKATRINDRYWR